MRITPDLNSCLPSIAPILGTVALLSVLCACSPSSSLAAEVDPRYEHEKTRDLVRLVNDAAELVEKEGEKAFRKLRVPKSRWQHDESYVFVFNPDGKMLVHGGPAMEGQDLMELKDVDGRPIFEASLRPPRRIPTEHRAGTTTNGRFPGQSSRAGRAAMSVWSKRPPANASSSTAGCTTTEWRRPLSWIW